jgi:hypothetical protein
MTLYYYAECHVLFIVTLNVIMLSVVTLNVVVLNVAEPLDRIHNNSFSSYLMKWDQ